MKPISQRIAEELGVREEQVQAAVALLDEGATVPFIARYRKEVTSNLTDTHLRELHQRLAVLRDLENRRETVIHTIREQGKLTPALEQALQEAETRTRLEDLYLPYRPKRRTKAALAREAGLQPLAELLARHPEALPEALAQPFAGIDPSVPDVAAALEGAREILVDQWSDDAELVGVLRQTLWREGVLSSRVVKGKDGGGAKFSDYFDFAEALCRIPAHRALALFRGKAEGVLRLAMDHPRDAANATDALGVCEQLVARHVQIQPRGRPGDLWLLDTVRQTWRKRLRPHLDTDLTKQLTEMAHGEAIRVFASNLKDLLLAAPAGTVAVMGLDPGLRTGVKVAVVDATGKVVATDTLYPHQPRNQWSQSLEKLALLVRRHGVRLISIGNGTASRETDRLVGDLRKAHPELGVAGVVVSEAGASVYSASEYASRELPEMDVSLRGAVSIARRLQDPLAELVKIDPRAIGVGQYQHDVDERQLAAALDGVVEDAVNAVGVDVNIASAPLLERVSGLNATLAKNIVAHRDQVGFFRNRKELTKVPRFGPKAFELAAGFLRIQNGDTPLDASAVHPESYPVVERILKKTGKALSQLVGDREVLRSLPVQEFVDQRFGEPTVRDILQELEKPGRDPRPAFHTPAFREGVSTMEDLRPGMILEGVVSNVTNFGAFVDIGVHQDGLVHISALADRFVKDPREVVKAGAIVQVRVLEVDLPRRRIALTLRLTEAPKPAAPAPRPAPAAPRYTPPQPDVADNAMLAAFARATRGKR